MQAGGRRIANRAADTEGGSPPRAVDEETPRGERSPSPSPDWGGREELERTRGPCGWQGYGWWRKTRSRARPEIEPPRKGRGQVIVTPVSENPQHPTQLPNTDKGYKVNTTNE